MTVVSFIGPGGVAVSVLYSAVVEDMIFNGNAPKFMPDEYWEGSLYICF